MSNVQTLNRTPVHVALLIAVNCHVNPLTGFNVDIFARRLPAHCIVAVIVTGSYRFRNSSTDKSSSGFFDFNFASTDTCKRCVLMSV